MSIVNANRADLRFNGSSVKLVAGPGAGPPGAASGITVTTSGNVGIGTDAPGDKLHVAGGASVAGTASIDENVIVGDALISARIVTGNAMQNVGDGGFVKAMVYVAGNGAIVRSYNPYASTTVQHSGDIFGIGLYRINFGFKVDHRFYSLTAQHQNAFRAGVNFQIVSATEVDVMVFEPESGGAINSGFMMLVY